MTSSCLLARQPVLAGTADKSSLDLGIHENLARKQIRYGKKRLATVDKYNANIRSQYVSRKPMKMGYANMEQREAGAVPGMIFFHHGPSE